MVEQNQGVDVVEQTRSFFAGSSGRWAGDRMLAALKAGRPLNASVLRTNDTLRHEEWLVYDQALVAEALIRLRGVADLIGAGLTKPIPNSLGKTMLMWEKVSDMDDASVSMDGIVRTENQRVEYAPEMLPLPITHKDWFLDLRTLAASRTTGEPLDTTQTRLAGRKVTEMAEKMLFQGGKTFGGKTIYGYTTHPDRNTVGFGTNGSWDQAAKVGVDYLADVQSMIAAAVADRMYGPYALYIPGNVSVRLTGDFKANTSTTILDRLLSIEGITSIRTVDQLPSANVLLVQLTSDVVEWAQGEQLQTIQWDTEGGFKINFKAFQIGIPLIKSDYEGRSGIVHMS